MKILSILFLILLFACSASNKETTSTIEQVRGEKPTPEGGDEEVRSIFLDELEESYEEIRGANVEFSMWVNESGYVDLIQGVIAIKDKKMLEGAILVKLKDTMMNNIRFNPAIVNGRNRRVFFYYSITF
jgi:hypothetical protein